MTQNKFNKKMKKIMKDNASKQRKLLLKKAKDKYKKTKKTISTSKLVLLVLILFCLQIVLFAEYIMMQLGDTSALYVLIGVPATLIPVVWKYYSKSQAENTQGGIVYETAMIDCCTTESEEPEDCGTIEEI